MFRIVRNGSNKYTSPTGINFRGRQEISEDGGLVAKT